MKFALETIDGIRVIKDSPEIEYGALRVMSPCWKGHPTPEGNPSRFLDYRRYDATGETHEGCPLFREVDEIASLRAQLEQAQADAKRAWTLVGIGTEQLKEAEAELSRLRASAGGDWAEAAARELMELYDERPSDPIYFHLHRWNQKELATIIRKHAPHAPAIDEQKVREAGRRFVENLLLPHSVDANEEHEHKVDRITEQLMDALRPLLGRNEEGKP